MSIAPTRPSCPPPLASSSFAAGFASAVAVIVNDGIVRGFPTCTRARCVPARGPSVQCAHASPSESVRADIASIFPPSSTVHVTGTSASAAPAVSVTRTPTACASTAPAAPFGTSRAGCTRVSFATGSASALAVSALSTPATVMINRWRPACLPSVHTARTRPFRSVSAFAGSALPSSASVVNVTLTSGTGRPARDDTCTSTGSGSLRPAGARCAWPPANFTAAGVSTTSAAMLDE